MARGGEKLLQEVRLRSRELSFESPDTTDRERVRVPFGIEIDTERFRFRKTAGPDTPEIRAYSLEDKTERYTVVSPGYTAKDHVKDPETGREIGVRLWTVYSDRDRLDARQVIQRVHYLADSGRGMFLACAVGDAHQRERIRKRRRVKNQDSSDVSWFVPCGGVVACGVISRLWHGNPVAGRQMIADQLKLKDRWQLMKRDEILRKMRIAWASRFAVDLPYQGLGLGTVLAKHLKKVAHYYHAPSADFLEVITTTNKDAPPPIAKDFLIRAGYTKLEAPMKSGSLMVMDGSGYRVPKSAIKNYYYADLRNE